MRKLIFFLSAFFLFFAVHMEAKTKRSKAKEKSVKIRMIVNDKILTATMYHNPTAKDFLSLLPLTLTLEDYAGTEKVSQLPKKLSLKDAPAGIDPSVGDITYYSPWGNLAIFYRDFGYAGGLIKLGRIDSNIEVLREIKKPVTVKFELINDDK